jgi:hypothetical protein
MVGAKQMTETIDLVREDKRYYSAPTTPVRVTFPTLSYLAVAGAGKPGGPAHLAATEALYTVAYDIRQRAKAGGMAFTVPKLEGLWWVDGPGEPLATPRTEWRWRLLIRLPATVSAADIDVARGTAARKKPRLPVIQDVGFDQLTEGDCVQVMHVGPYDAEPKTLAQLERYMDEHGLRMAGRHHEIYLSDPLRATAERLRTILRHPVAPIHARRVEGV